MNRQVKPRAIARAKGTPVSHSSPDSIPSLTNMQETSDHHAGVIACLCPRHIVITCRDDLQWIIQRRKKGGADRPWRAIGYFLTREALIRFCATLNARIDPAAMAALAALPELFGGSR